MRLDQRNAVAALACAAWLATVAPAVGQEPTIELPQNANAVVLEYNTIHHMLAQQDPEPLLRVFADGRVRVHHPVYMAKAGDYETRLSDGELRGILESFAAGGILDFNTSVVKSEREQAEAADRAAGILLHVSDVSETVIGVRLGSYQAPGALAPTENFETSVRWPNLYTDAQRFGAVAGIQSLARAEQSLRSIVNRTDLVKVR